MASTSLSEFPAELVLNIYESLDDHQSITALNLASRKFYDIWQLNTESIAKFVLSQSIDCFDLAQKLVALQDESVGGRVETREAVLVWSKYLVMNASIVLKDYTSGNVSLSRLHRRERLDFTQSHYRVWILVTLCCDQEAQMWLQAATLEELEGMAMTADWLGVIQGDVIERRKEYWWCMLHTSGCNWNRIQTTIEIIREQVELRDSLS